MLPVGIEQKVGQLLGALVLKDERMRLHRPQDAVASTTNGCVEGKSFIPCHVADELSLIHI